MKQKLYWTSSFIQLLVPCTIYLKIYGCYANIINNWMTKKAKNNARKVAYFTNYQKANQIKS